MKNKLFINITSLLALLAVSVQPVYARIVNPVIGSCGSGQPETCLAVTLANIWRASLVIGSIAFVLYFAWGSLRIMTSEGDKGKFDDGQKKISNSLIGLILIAASVAIVQLLGTVFNIQFLQTLIFDFPRP